jgi:hypothetical protein
LEIIENKKTNTFYTTFNICRFTKCSYILLFCVISEKKRLVNTKLIARICILDILVLSSYYPVDPRLVHTGAPKTFVFDLHFFGRFLCLSLSLPDLPTHLSINLYAIHYLYLCFLSCTNVFGSSRWHGRRSPVSVSFQTRPREQVGCTWTAILFTINVS